MRRGLIIFIGLFAAWLLPSAAAGKAFPQTTAANSATPILTTTRTWDYGMRLRSIANVVDSTPVTAHAYQYDALNRRTQATLEDGSAWLYGYNGRDELTNACRKWSYFSTTTPVAGQQFSYAYDMKGSVLYFEHF